MQGPSHDSNVCRPRPRRYRHRATSIGHRVGESSRHNQSGALAADEPAFPLVGRRLAGIAPWPLARLKCNRTVRAMTQPPSWSELNASYVSIRCGSRRTLLCGRRRTRECATRQVRMTAVYEQSWGCDGRADGQGRCRRRTRPVRGQRRSRSSSNPF